MEFEQRLAAAYDLAEASLQEAFGDQRAGSLVVLEDDFYIVEIKERFDVVCCWETFGLGTDTDQRRQLRRIEDEWLKPDGCVLMDVYSPVRPARDAGTERRLPPLKDVPGSLEMINRCYFDPFQSRWIDEWIPVGEPEKALAQTVRCYTPADFLLLLEGTGLSIKRVEVKGEQLEMPNNNITVSSSLMDAWCYLDQLTAYEQEEYITQSTKKLSAGQLF